MRGKVITVDQVIARIAGRQHGVVARWQLLGAGVTSREIEIRVGRGSLLPVLRGVYRVGHAAPSVQSTYMAAVLACGEGAVLCGRAAAYLLGLIKGSPPPPEVLTRGERRIKGVRARRSRVIESIIWRGIPITTPARTLVDLAAALNEEQLARAAHEADVRYKTTPAQVEAVLRSRPRTNGATMLRRVVSGDVKLVLSTLERRFLALLRENDVPLPRTNRAAGGRFVDCRWPEHRLTVELDSYRFHNSRHAWEQDRRREREAYARGDQHRRYTYRDVFEDPGQMLAELRTLLA